MWIFVAFKFFEVRCGWVALFFLVPFATIRSSAKLKYSQNYSKFLFPNTGKPQIIEKTDTSVTLSWIRSNAIGASSLLGYTVEMFSRNSTDGWVQVANRIQNTTYKIIGLTSGASYYFAVRAENSHGVSGPSQLSEPITIGVVRYNSYIFLICTETKKNSKKWKEILHLISSVAWERSKKREQKSLGNAFGRATY